jgi:hypothetical protein
LISVKDPAASAKKWAQNTAASSQAIIDGANRVTVSPGVAAARQADVWAANTAAAKDKFKARVGSMSLQEWQQSMATKAAPRVAQGAAGAEDKMASFLGHFLPFVEQKVAALPPRGTLDQNIQRSAALQRALATYKRP